VLYGLVLLMVLCWSGNYIAAKVVFREMPALVAMTLRSLVAAIVMLPIFWKRIGGAAFLKNKREITILVGLGLFGTALNQFFWTIGVAKTTVIHSSMIMGTVPIWVLLIAGVLKIERITFPKVGGIAIATAGLAILQAFRSNVAGKSPTLLGDFLVLLCALALAGTTAFGKVYRPESGGIGVNTVGYVAAAALLLPTLWLPAPGFRFADVTPAAWAGICYMGAISSVTGYLIYYWALTRIPASRMAAFQYLQPVFASLMAVAMLGEDLTGGALAAGGIISMGVFVTERFG
jgi:drug/metabolite transporter (DMT)-like permease